MTHPYELLTADYIVKFYFHNHVSHRELDRRIADGSFPRGFQMCPRGKRYWKRGDVEAWIDATATPEKMTEINEKIARQDAQTAHMRRMPIVVPVTRRTAKKRALAQHADFS